MEDGAFGEQGAGQTLPGWADGRQEGGYHRTWAGLCPGVQVQGDKACSSQVGEITAEPGGERSRGPREERRVRRTSNWAAEGRGLGEQGHQL